MERKDLKSLTRELKLKKFQFNSIYEFSSSIYSSFKLESIIRIFFSTLMGQLGISRIFYLDLENGLLKHKGFQISDKEEAELKKTVETLESDWFQLEVSKLKKGQETLKKILLARKIYYLVNISDSTRKKIILGLGLKFNTTELNNENIEYAFFLSKFTLIAIENSYYVKKMIENKRIEHEMKIAKDIQSSLMPQTLPSLKNFEIGVIYQPTFQVGGDYYDILKQRKGKLPVLIADVEGKGLPAALLAASSQAVIHSLNEFEMVSEAEFIKKANSLIFEFTKGKNFITLCWLVLNDKNKSISYVNAGHAEPYFVSGKKIRKLTKGGFLTGFLKAVEYEQETIKVKMGDLLIAFTDGVPEVENKSDKEFGEKKLLETIIKYRDLPAEEIVARTFERINRFSQNRKFRDDFTLIVIKVK